MTNFKISINQHCPCTQPECPIRGNCVLCIQNHMEHKRHVPECVENLLRPMVKDMADLLELKTEDNRPDAAFWAEYDKENLVKKSLDRHKKKR